MAAMNALRHIPDARRRSIVSAPLPLLFGGGRENSRALSRRVRWISENESKSFMGVKAYVRSHFGELCRFCPNAPNPNSMLKLIDGANAIVVSEDLVPMVDPINGRIVHPQPLMAPNTTLKLTGFILVRLLSSSSSSSTILVDAICTTPGRSQAKAMLQFFIRKAKALGFSHIRIGESPQIIPTQLEQPSSDDDDTDEEDDDDDDDSKQQKTPYALLMGYLAGQRMYKPKLAGHLIQFYSDE